MPKFLSAFAALILLCCPTLLNAQPCGPANSIVSVKNYVSGGFGYVEFRVKLPTSPSFSYTVTKVIGPTFEHDPTADTITVAGPLWTQVRFASVYWKCIIPISLSPGNPVKDIKSTGQFEGYVTFVIGRCAGSKHISTTQYSSVDGLYRLIRLKFTKCRHTLGPACCQPCAQACCEESW